MDNKNSAKFAFFYMLSLISLVFTAIAVGIVFFQLINKNIIDIVSDYSGSFDSGALKYAISSLLIAAPIYFVVMWLINSYLKKGELKADSQIRRWLTYLILLVSFVVMIGWLIGLVNSYLDGELTQKFILKFLTALLISGLIFAYYLYDIRREKVKNGKDKVVQSFFYGGIALVVLPLVLAFMNVESPRETKMRKIDESVLRSFSQIRYAIDNYYQGEQVLPGSLEVLKDSNYTPIINEDQIKHPQSGNSYEYNIIATTTYELCADFLTANKNREDSSDQAYKDEFPHDIGRQCFKLQAREDNTKGQLRPLPVEP